MTAIKLFKASWCGYCLIFEEEWKSFQDKCDELGIKTETLDVDNIDDKKEFVKEHITSFPTIKIYYNGESAVYSGDRNGDSILDELYRLKYRYYKNKYLNLKNKR